MLTGSGAAPLSLRAASAIAFVSAAAVLVLEIVAGRAIAPYVGVSLESYTAAIGIVLSGIAAGAFLGGWLADRFGARRVIPPALVVAGTLSLLALPLIRALSDDEIGARWWRVTRLVGVGFLLPATAASMVAPALVKLQLADLATTGRVVGRLSGMGTAGAIVGSFAAGAAQSASWSSVTLLGSASAVLTTIGVVAWFRLAAGSRVVLAGLLTLTGGAAALNLGDGRCDTETGYYCVRIENDPIRPTVRNLFLDDLWHSSVDTDDDRFVHPLFDIHRAMAAVIDVAAPPAAPIRALTIGAGGFTIPRYIRGTRPGSDDVVIEIDDQLVAIARRRLGLRLGDGLSVRTGDGRTELRRQPDARFDLVVGDAFASQAVPFHLATVEFVRDVRRTLRPSGLYLQNLIDSPGHDFVRADLATVRRVFDNVVLLSHPDALAGRIGANFLVVASDGALPVNRIAAVLSARGIPWRLADRAETARFAGRAALLTDDHAPVNNLITT